MADDPPYLTVGTEVSAKYKGAFCEAKIRKVVRVVKCKVTFKAGNGSALLTDDQIKGTLRIGAVVEAKHPDKNTFIEATINKIQDSSQYTVVFDDGDITTLRRSALCLKSGRHFNESETLDQLPLTHPEHFSNPVVGGRRGARRRAADKDDSSEEEEEEELPPKRDGRKKYEKELDMGKVVCVESTDKKKSKDTWFPALVVSPSAQETVKIRTKDEYLVRSFRDGRYYTVPKKEITEFTKDYANKHDSNSNVLRTAVDKALSYLERNELPPHWDREVLFSNARQSESADEDQQSESEVEDYSGNEEKDRFIAQLYKFMDDRSTPLNKVPQVCNKDLDLHKLFKMVGGKGGYTKVTNQGQWKAVTIKLGYGTMPSTSTINLVKQAYKKFLCSFEEFYRKLGCTWPHQQKSQTSTSKSRTSRSIFRERGTPSSSSRESGKDKKGGEDDDGRSTPSSTKGKDKPEKSSQDEKEKLALSSPEVDSPAPGGGDTGSESSDVKPKADPPEEIRKSARGRQPKKDRDAEESVSPSAASRKKRQATASRDRDRDSSVASSTKEESGSAPSTPSTKDGAKTSSNVETSPTGKKGIGAGPGRGRYKRQSGKGGEIEDKEPPSSKDKEEEKVIETAVTAPVVNKSGPEIRLGDKLQVYYPKSEGKTYEAKVIDINETKGTFFVHYTGWNNRYDEWIDKARVSENITLKMEQSGEDQTPSVGKSDAGTKSQGPGAKQRKGRNSSSATSTTSASSGTTTSTVTTAPPPTTPGSTRSAKATIPASSSSPVSGKRRRSTSSEVVQTPPAVKRRRTRQRSGQDTAASQPSESEPETSDSDGKSIKSEKTTSDAANEGRKGPLSRKDMTTPTPASDTKTSGKKGTLSAEDTKPVTKSEKAKSRSSDLNDGNAASSSKTKDVGKHSVAPPPLPAAVIEDSKESSSSSNSTTGNGQVLDLDQIRSEMKGLDKMVKGGVPSNQSVSSPAPPTLSAVGGASSQSEASKVDVYEFMEDGAEDAAPPIPPTAPKLKMFSPVARSSTSPASASAAEKLDKSPVVSSSSAELVAKLGSTQDAQEKVPVVSIEKMDRGKEKDKTSKPDTKNNVEPSMKESVPKTVSGESPTSAVLTSTGKDTGKTSAAKIPPQITSFITHPITAAAAPATTSSLASAAPPLPILSTASGTPITVIASGISASSLTPITTAPVIIAPGTGPTITIPSTALKGKGAAFLTKATTVPVTATIVGNPPRIVSVLSSAAAASTIPSPSSSHPSPTVLISGNNTASVITPKVIATISPGTIPTTTPTVITTLASSITSPPPLLLQQPRPPVITLASPAAMAMTPSPKSTPERPALTPVVSSTSASGPSGKVDLKSGSTSIPFTARKQELFPNLIQRLPADPSATASIPTISIIAAKPSMAETSNVESSGSMSSGSIPPPQPVQQQPIKIAAAIPPPPPVVVKPPTKSTFGTSSAGGVGSHMDTPKQKKKKAKSTLSGQGTTPSQPKTLAPLPMVGAPPPPPVVITNMTTSTTTTITSTPTPGRKTPVKKRIPPPMESPGKPVKPFSVHGGLATPPTKPGKMNQEAMNAAIANVGATTPSTSSVPTTVITSTSAIFQPHPPGSTGIIFASALSNQPPPPPVNIASKNIIPPVTIKSSAESIAASIAAVASMGTSSMPPKATTTATSLIGKSGMPMKRFMKDNAGDKMTPGNNKDKVYTISSSAPITSHQPVSSQVTSSPNIVIGKSMQSNEHKSPQQHQSSHHSLHPPPSITIQAQFQPAHSMAGSGSNVPTTGPSSTTYVKSLGTPSSGNILDPHHQAQQHQAHPQQSNLPKNPVIIIPAAPVVIKPAPYQQQSSPHGQPMIVPKPVHVNEGPYSQQASTKQSNPSILVTSTSDSATGKQQILPITVTPSNIQQVGHVASSLSSTSMHLSNVTTTGGAAHHRTSLPAVELKPVISSSTPPSNTADLPASITVTKATTVMKSVSPDIVAVSSYSSIRSTATSSSTSSFTPMKQENRAQAVKDPEIVVKPAPASTQIVFHTAPDSKKGITDSIHQLQSRPSLIPKAEEKDTDESSLLCEEIIPGSPTAGDPDDKSDDDTDKEMKNDTGSKKGKPDASVISMMGKDSPRSSSGGTTPRSVSGSGNKPVIVVGPKCGEDSLDEDRSRFVLEEKSCKFDDDEDDNKLMDDRSVDSPMGPPSEGREADLQFRDSFSEGGDQSPPLSPSTSSSISSDDSSRQHDTNRLSPTPEGGSSKSKDSDDDDMDSDVGSKSTHLDDADSKHGSTRGSTRIRNQSSRLGRSPSPPSNKRRRIMRRKSPEDVTRFIGRTIRTSSGRKITPAGRHGGDCYVEKEKEVKQPPPPPPVNLAKPPKTGKYNFIPNLTGVDDPEQRIALISQCINDLKEQYQKTKTEAASFDRRVKRWKRRIREKERLARQEATRAAS